MMPIHCTQFLHDWTEAPDPYDPTFDYDSLLGKTCCCGAMILVPGPLAGCDQCPQAPVPVDSVIAEVFLASHLEPRTIYRRHTVRRRPARK